MRKLSKIEKLFFNFYVLNEVWFRTVGMESYGYYTTNILPYNKERIINETFENTVKILKEKLIKAFEATIRGELRHFENECFNCIDHTRNSRKKVEQFVARNGKNHSRWNLNQIKEAYMTLRWEDSYGGKKWGVGTDYLIKLKASTSIKDDVFYIDRIFDLQHNTGFILNKTIFRVLENYIDIKIKNRTISSKLLNVRFRASVEEMLDCCSFFVKKIFIANKNYIYPTLLQS